MVLPILVTGSGSFPPDTSGEILHCNNSTKKEKPKFGESWWMGMGLPLNAIFYARTREEKGSSVKRYREREYNQWGNKKRRQTVCPLLLLAAIPKNKSFDKVVFFWYFFGS